MSMKPETAARIAKIKKVLLKAAVIAAVVLNAILVLPGIIMGIMTSHYVPSIMLVVLSAIAWAVGWGIVAALRARRTRLEGEASE